MSNTPAAARVRELIAENAKLRELLAYCADDLEEEIHARCGSPVHPAMQAKFERDMSAVIDARRALGESK